MLRFVLLLGLIMLVLVPNLSWAEIPKLINYQGMLTDNSGNPLNGTYSIIFKIYNAESGGTERWQETQSNVTVTNGLFNVILGSVTSIDLDFSEDYWLDITVGGEQMPTRLKFTSVGYAYRAKIADSATVAVSAPTGGGWVDDGSVVRLQTSTDNVGIGTNSPDERLHLENSESGGRSFLQVEASHASNWSEAGLRIKTPQNTWHLRMDDDSNNNIPNGALGLRSQDLGNEVMVWTDSGKVGVGTTSPAQKLHVAGTIQMTGYKMSTGAAAGFVLTSDASGVGTWQALTGLPSGTSGQTLRHDGTNWVTNSLLYNNGTNVGVGTTTPAQKLHVAGTAQMTGFKMSTGASNGYVLTSDASGVGTWQAAPGGSDNDWCLTSEVLYTCDQWGIARYGNELWGNRDSTHVNLGVACTTGRSGQNYKYCTVGGGVLNASSNTGATVGGGQDNTASASNATVGGGHDNTANGITATVAGGGNNTASATCATVGGGSYDTASGNSATVAGGEDNTASGAYATVAGGRSNTASGNYSFVGGGLRSTAIGSGSTVCCGEDNYCSGSYSIITGGVRDTLTASADYSMAFGINVYLNTSDRVALFEGTSSGRLGINRDDHDGGISYPIHVGTSASNGNGARLTGGGVWTDGSSRTFKENFHPLDGENLLSKISKMPVQAWQFKDSDERHIGPVAEDFVEAFDVGTIREDGTREHQYLAASDVAGVALVGVKELARQNQELRQIIEELRQRIAELERAK